MCMLQDRRTPAGIMRDLLPCSDERCLSRDYALHCGYSVMIFPGDAPGCILPSGAVVWVTSSAKRCRVRRRKPAGSRP
jgi:hypothetical protein